MFSRPLETGAAHEAQLHEAQAGGCLGATIWVGYYHTVFRNVSKRQGSVHHHLADAEEICHVFEQLDYFQDVPRGVPLATRHEAIMRALEYVQNKSLRSQAAHLPVVPECRHPTSSITSCTSLW
jgi:hypothetical protein